MSKKIKIILIGLAGLILLAVLIYQIPYVKSVVSWRVEKYTIYAKNVIDPAGPVPTALPVTPRPPTPTAEVSDTLHARDRTHSICHAYSNLPATASAGLHHIPAIRTADTQQLRTRHPLDGFAHVRLGGSQAILLASSSPFCRTAM